MRGPYHCRFGNTASDEEPRVPVQGEHRCWLVAQADSDAQAITIAMWLELVVRGSKTLWLQAQDAIVIDAITAASVLAGSAICFWFFQ